LVQLHICSAWSGASSKERKSPAPRARILDAPFTRLSSVEPYNPDKRDSCVHSLVTDGETEALKGGGGLAQNHADGAWQRRDAGLGYPAPGNDAGLVMGEMGRCGEQVSTSPWMRLREIKIAGERSHLWHPGSG
jgi:hypothetical protein